MAYTIKKLQEMCKERGIKGYSKFKKQELLDILEIDEKISPKKDPVDLKTVDSVHVTKFQTHIKLSEMTKRLRIESNIVGKYFEYSDLIIEGKLYSVFGAFVDYLIRHMICSEKNISCRDERGEKCPVVSSSYEIFTTNKNSREILGHIWNTSLAHGTAFGELNIKLLDKEPPIESKMIDSIESYIDKKLQGVSTVVVRPSFSNEKLGVIGYGDLIVGRVSQPENLASMDEKHVKDRDLELIDFKVSEKDRFRTVNSFKKLFIYASLHYKNTKAKVNKLTIYNPLLGIEKSIDITNWGGYRKINRQLEDLEIGSLAPKDVGI